jgi:hypothetical protein
MFSERKLGLSAERLRELLHYAPETGLFYWRVSRGGVTAGMQAGHPHSDGYVLISIGGVTHYAHRLAWLYVYGEHPAQQIDHRNHNRSDNRIANLRQSSHAENARNTSRRNRPGFKGVYRKRSKWGARICVDGKRIYLGVVSTPEEAAAAHDKAARLHYGEFASTNEMLGLLPARDSGPGTPDSTIAGTPAPRQVLRSGILGCLCQMPTAPA